jgi:hypothetical protein
LVRSLFQTEKAGKCEPGILNNKVNTDSCPLEPLSLAITITGVIAHPERSRGWSGSWLYLGLKSSMKIAVRLPRFDGTVCGYEWFYLLKFTGSICPDIGQASKGIIA